MRGRLSIMLMALVALALTLSLVAAVASNASAQDSAIPTGGQGSWVRHNVPTAQDWQAAPDAQATPAARHCCISLVGGCYLGGISQESASFALNGFSVKPRWFCIDTPQ